MSWAQSWSPPQWSPHRYKHFAHGSDWDRIVRETGSGQRVAKYHCSLTEPQIRQLELRCVTELGAAIIPPKPHVIEYFMEVTDLDFAAGASQGEMTNFIYVEYHQAGTVHGRPITWSELRRKFKHAQTG